MPPAIIGIVVVVVLLILIGGVFGYKQYQKKKIVSGEPEKKTQIIDGDNPRILSSNNCGRFDANINHFSYNNALAIAKEHGMTLASAEQVINAKVVPDTFMGLILVSNDNVIYKDRNDVKILGLDKLNDLPSKFTSYKDAGVDIKDVPLFCSVGYVSKELTPFELVNINTKNVEVNKPFMDKINKAMASGVAKIAPIVSEVVPPPVKVKTPVVQNFSNF
jgi:hypothetical protein